MIAMLTRLNPQSPTFIENVAEYENHRQRCPVCQGVRRMRKNCLRCNGTGQSHDTGGQRSSMSPSNLDRLDGPQVAALCAGVAEHKFWAAMVYVTDDPVYKAKLVNHLRERVIRIASADWVFRDDEEGHKKEKMIKGLALLAVIELGYMRSDQVIMMSHVYKILGCNRRQYYKKWRSMRDLYFSRVNGWVDDVEVKMRTNYYDRKK